MSFCPTSGLLIVGVFVVWYGIVGYGLYIGVNLIIEGSQYASDSSEETCLLIDVEMTECSYDCDCKGEENTICDTCWGMQYEYLANVESKCGNQTLFSSELDVNCPMTLLDMEKEHSCYVLDCEIAEFTFISTGMQIAWGVAVTAFVSLFCMAPLACGYDHIWALL